LASTNSKLEELISTSCFTDDSTGEISSNYLKLIVLIHIRVVLIPPIPLIIISTNITLLILHPLEIHKLSLGNRWVRFDPYIVNAISSADSVRWNVMQWRYRRLIFSERLVKDVSIGDWNFGKIACWKPSWRLTSAIGDPKLKLGLCTLSSSLIWLKTLK